MQELIKDKLYSFDEKVRVELGPQIVELDCNDETISDKVTHTNYQIGKIDAFGKVIKKGEPMQCVDWRANMLPHLWKVYQMQEVGKEDFRFIKIKEFEDKVEAMNFAKLTLKEMK